MQKFVVKKKSQYSYVTWNLPRIRITVASLFKSSCTPIVRHGSRSPWVKITLVTLGVRPPWATLMRFDASWAVALLKLNDQPLFEQIVDEFFVTLTGRRKCLRRLRWKSPMGIDFQRVGWASRKCDAIQVGCKSGRSSDEYQ